MLDALAGLELRIDPGGGGSCGSRLASPTKGTHWGLARELTSSGGGVDRGRLGISGRVAGPREGAALAIAARVRLARRGRTGAAVEPGAPRLRLGLVEARTLCASLGVVHGVRVRVRLLGGNDW